MEYLGLRRVYELLNKEHSPKMIAEDVVKDKTRYLQHPGKKSRLLVVVGGRLADT